MSRTNSGAVRSAVGAAVLVVVLGVAPAANAADVSTSVNIASRYAAAAAAATTVNEAKINLQSMLNCIVGVGGNGFRADVPDPCAGAAILPGVHPHAASKYELAASVARPAVSYELLQTTRLAARAIQRVLGVGPSIWARLADYIHPYHSVEGVLEGVNGAGRVVMVDGVEYGLLPDLTLDLDIHRGDRVELKYFVLNGGRYVVGASLPGQDEAA
jgi:hypothetical protein